MLFRRLRRRQQKLMWTSLVVFNLFMVAAFVATDKDLAEWLNGNVAVPGGSGFNNRTNGYRRAKYMKDLCNKGGMTFPQENVRVYQKYTTSTKGLHLCPVWKVGTTFLKRVFMIEALPKYQEYSNPYDISFLESYEGDNGTIPNLDNSMKFMFVRDPYQRLLSVYVDKLLAPNPVYWGIIGIPGIKQSRQDPSALSVKCGHDLTFNEFIKYVVSALYVDRSKRVRPFAKSNKKVGVARDFHFEIYSFLCKPCGVNYDFIGKMETFKEDSLELVRQMNLPNVAKVLESQGEYLSVKDAIKDTVHQPFYQLFKNKISRCIGRKEALKRAWRKLQARGLIGVRDLDLMDSEADDMTQEQFEKLAFEAREDSTKEERRRVKLKFYNEMYGSVDRSDLEKISIIYHDDFLLFDYDSRPKDLFDRAL